MSTARDDFTEAARLARALHSRPGVGVAAHILQGRRLEVLRARVEQPALILVDRGIKSVRTDQGSAVQAQIGQAIVLEGNQTVDFTNSVPSGDQYEARWLVFDTSLLEDVYYQHRCACLDQPTRASRPIRLLSHVHDNLASAFETARRALAPAAQIPDSIARHRLLEVMHWLLEDGIALRSSPISPSVSVKVRALVAGRLDGAWTTDRVARELALSEATLRRRLAAEGTSLTDLLADTRMSVALTLLQATTQPVASIALALGYESASRFAIRFRQRFGFAPTAVRGHERAT